SGRRGRGPRVARSGRRATRSRPASRVGRGRPGRVCRGGVGRIEGSRRYHRHVVDPFLPDSEKLSAVREGLPALGAGIYLNTGTAGPIPSETAAAMAEIVDYELRIGRAHMDYFTMFLERLEEARAAVAAIVAADIDEIAITHSTS